MLPGAGIARIARRRRVHYHGDAASSAAGAAEHARHHHHYGHSYYAHHAASSTTGVAGPALAARIRLEEKLRGAALPSRLMRDGRTTIPGHPQRTQRDDQDVLPATDAEHEHWRPAAPLLQAAALASASAVPSPVSASASTQRELTRTLSKVDVCAVCLEEVRPAERRQRQRAVTRLPCSHKYHSECVLPWLAVHPDCPCCRALVPSADTLVQVGDS